MEIEKCPHCQQERKAQKSLIKSGDFHKTCYTNVGSKILGADSLKPVEGEKYLGYPRCPECQSFLGAASNNFDFTEHQHFCQTCGWESKIYQGDFIDSNNGGLK